MEKTDVDIHSDILTEYQTFSWLSLSISSYYQSKKSSISSDTFFPEYLSLVKTASFQAMGKLIIKAALSVFICCLIYEFFDIGTGIPFYSGIAAIICLQPEIKSTFRVGMNRTIGTLIGGFTGMVILFILREFSLFSFPTLKNFLISLCIIPLMFLAEFFKRSPLSKILEKAQKNNLFSIAPLIIFANFMRKSALTNITCIAFLSVTITHGEDMSISGFALNRIFDTLIGVFVSFFVNIIPFGTEANVAERETPDVE